MFSRKNSIFLFIFFVAFIVRCYHLGEPFIGIHDWGSADLSRAASSLLRYGFINLKGAPAFDIGIVPDGNYSYYLHWPLLFYYIVALSFKYFGIVEWAARLIPVLFSTATVFYIYKISKSLYGKRIAYFAILVFALMPLNVYFDRIVQFESVSVFFIMMAIYYYMVWFNNGQTDKKKFWMLIISFILGTQIHWQNYLLAVLLIVHYFFLCKIQKKKIQREILFIPLLAIFLFILHFIYMVWILGKDAISDMAKQALHRLNISGASREVLFTPSQFLELQAYRMYHYFTIVAVVLLACWVVFLIVDLLKKRNLAQRSFECLFLLIGLSWIVLFTNHSYIHEFTLLTFAAVVSILMSSALRDILAAISSVMKLGEKKFVWKSIFVLIVLVMFIPQSILETARLHSWHGDLEKWYILGTDVKGKTKPDSIVMTDFDHPGPPTLQYYADQQVIYGFNDPKSVYDYFNKSSIKHLYLITNLATALDYYKDYRLLPLAQGHVLVDFSIFNGVNKKQTIETLNLDETFDWEAVDYNEKYKLIRVNLRLDEQPYVLLNEKDENFTDYDADMFESSGLSDIYGKNGYLYLTIPSDTIQDKHFTNEGLKLYFKNHHYKLVLLPSE
ncbi:ArnT family glycosyltransferase [Paenibacillus sp. QZ-Y1]|uniref:ArnT family glycosyltransferase n=1 Tax=Paenibacillus sp. QZ-Y1 TaxID=3414511 RepID=UPI003F7AF862